MAWGGGGGFGGGPMGGPPGPTGLPFGGIPSEMQSGVEKLLAHEPDWPLPDVDFSQVPPETKAFTLGSFLRPHAPALALGIALVIVETLAAQAGPWLTGRAIDRGVLRGNFGVVFQLGAVYVTTVVLHTVVLGIRTTQTGALGQKLMYQLRLRVFAHIQRLSLDYFTDERAGRIMTRMTSDIEALSELLQDGIINLAVQAFTLVIVVVVLFTIDAELAIIVLVAVVPVMTLMTLWFRSASTKGYAAVRERIADVMADLQENLAGIRVVTAYNRQAFNIARHRDAVGRHRDANLVTARISAVYGPGAETVGALGTALILMVGGRLVLNDEMSVGDLTAFVLYLATFFAPIQQLVQLYTTYQSGQAAIVKLRDLLGTAPSVVEDPDAIELPPIEGAITLENVTFSYEPGRTVLTDVELALEPGETLAVVGPTGAGKSTIAKLITRFYDPDTGRVLVDGYDIRHVTLRSLRRQLGVVPQEPFLFAGTIRDNVAFARPEAADEEVMEACRQVGLDDLVERMPDGLDAPVFERGSSLSSGERQLLALARAMLAKPRVLVLDEATSSLDLRSETIIDRALDVVLEGRTAVIIAHRLSTARRADRIAVIDGGRVVELGSHDDLVAAGGTYAEMWATWESHLQDPHTTAS